MMHVKAAFIALAALVGAMVMTPVQAPAIPLAQPISIDKGDGSNIVDVRHRKHWRKHRSRHAHRHRHWRRHAWRHRHYHHRRYWARRYWCDPYYEYCPYGYYRRPGFGIYLDF